MISSVVCRALKMKDDLALLTEGRLSVLQEHSALLIQRHSYLICYDEYTGQEYSTYATHEEIRSLDREIYEKRLFLTKIEGAIERVNMLLQQLQQAVGEEAWNRRKHAIWAWVARQKMTDSHAAE
jgi:hypothetical protein